MKCPLCGEEFKMRYACVYISGENAIARIDNGKPIVDLSLSTIHTDFGVVQIMSGCCDKVVYQEHYRPMWGEERKDPISTTPRGLANLSSEQLQELAKLAKELMKGEGDGSI